MNKMVIWIGIVLLIIAAIIGLIADAQIREYHEDEIDAVEDENAVGVINSYKDMLNAQIISDIAGTIFQLGLILVFIGLVLPRMIIYNESQVKQIEVEPF